MPGPMLPPGLEWTEEDVQAARRRGKKLALEHFQETPVDDLKFTAEQAAALIADEGLFANGSNKLRATMTYELHDFAHRFLAELREVSA